MYVKILSTWKFEEHSKEARVALGFASSNSNASFVLSKLSSAQYLDIRTLTDELIVNYLSMNFIFFFGTCILHIAISMLYFIKSYA